MTNSSSSDCPFCSCPPERIREQCDFGFVVDDLFPVMPGHSLIIAKRHTPSFFVLTREEIAALLSLLELARQRLEITHRPSGFNIGINVGAVAGQTIPHVHIHLIPRYPGDVADPVGGVRNIIPGKGRYGDKV